jgi:hypothetical protein
VQSGKRPEELAGHVIRIDVEVEKNLTLFLTPADDRRVFL